MITLQLYTQSSSFFNSLLRNGQGEERLIKLAEEVKLLPRHFGLWRGVETKYLLTEIEEGIWKPKGVVSCSKSQWEAAAFGFNPNESSSMVYIEDWGIDIEDYSLFPEEQECIFWDKEYYIYQESEIDIGCQRRLLWRAKPK